MELTKKEKKWRIELTEHQLLLMARCVEDSSRFLAGQTTLDNTRMYLFGQNGFYDGLADELRRIQPLVTPQLSIGASYGWSGSGCPNNVQSKAIAETYYLYREIYHQTTIERAKDVDIECNVYLDETLRCKDSGEPIKVERIE